MLSIHFLKLFGYLQGSIRAIVIDDDDFIGQRPETPTQQIQELKKKLCLRIVFVASIDTYQWANVSARRYTIKGRFSRSS